MTRVKKSSSASSSAKKKARRPAHRRNRLQASTTTVIVILGAVAGLIILAILIRSNKQSRAGGRIEGVQSFPNLERGHTTQPVTYAQNPPVGGLHNPAWQNCGVYTQPIANENGLHSLEHGAIWITYQPDLPAGEVQKLQAITGRVVTAC